MGVFATTLQSHTCADRTSTHAVPIIWMKQQNAVKITHVKNIHIKLIWVFYSSELDSDLSTICFLSKQQKKHWNNSEQITDELNSVVSIYFLMFLCVFHLTVAWKSPVSFDASKREKSKSRRKKQQQQQQQDISVAHVTYSRLTLLCQSTEANTPRRRHRRWRRRNEVEKRERKGKNMDVIVVFNETPIWLRVFSLGRAFLFFSKKKIRLCWNWLCLLNGLNRWERINFADHLISLYCKHTHTHSQNRTHIEHKIVLYILFFAYCVGLIFINEVYWNQLNELEFVMCQRHRI